MARRPPLALIVLAAGPTLATLPFVPRPAAQLADVSAGQRTALAFADNVVRVRMRGADRSDGEEGFGFVFGERGTDLYIATADHVVQDREHPLAEVIFYRDQGSPQRARVLELRLPREQGDLAVLSVRRPDSFRPDWLSIVPSYELRTTARAWRIGKQEGWVPPVVPGQFVRRLGTWLGFDNLDAPRGSSGGPIVSDQGVIGMIVADNQQAGVPTNVLPIDTIAGVVQGWNLPWNFAEPHATTPAHSVPDPSAATPLVTTPTPLVMNTPRPLLAPALSPQQQEDALTLNDSQRSEVQRRLSALGFDTNGVDADFGPDTRQAIRSYQSARGLPATGYVSAELFRRIVSEGAPPPSSAQPLPPLAPPPGLFANEAFDYGVQPQATLKYEVSNPTPTHIPGARVVTTSGLASWLRDAANANALPPLLIDAWGDRGHATIRGAWRLPDSGQGYSFDDRFQSQLAGDLTRLTGGRMDRNMVFFCAGPSCWESYNAALRALRAGYVNVFWYRGGMAAWDEARLPEMR